jgi:hypothetical protein
MVPSTALSYKINTLLAVEWRYSIPMQAPTKVCTGVSWYGYRGTGWGARNVTPYPPLPLPPIQANTHDVA